MNFLSIISLLLTCHEMMAFSPPLLVVGGKHKRTITSLKGTYVLDSLSCDGRVTYLMMALVEHASYSNLVSLASLQIYIYIVGYVPDGFTADQWQKMKQEEMQKKQRLNYGAVGPRGFKSRSLQSFQEDLEQGKVGHLLPVFNSKQKLKSGQLKQEDIPVSFIVIDIQSVML